MSSLRVIKAHAGWNRSQSDFQKKRERVLDGRSIMTPPTHFERDISRQTAELRQTLGLLTDAGQSTVRQAATLVRHSSRVFLTGIGASWHVALGAGVLFNQRGRPVYTVEAAELLHFTTIPRDSVVIAISRTGRSVEIVQLLAKARQAGASLIGITNSPESPLAKEASAAMVIPVALDYAISVNTYSTLAMAATALACCEDGDFRNSCAAFLNTLGLVEESLPAWREAIPASSWLRAPATYYFLARGPSLASCYQARLLWEEGAKSPATAMSTSGFRHGAQETVEPGMRFCIWIDPVAMRVQDLAVADDLRKLGAAVALIGQDLPRNSEHLVFHIPPAPASWQFVVDMIPMQLAAEALARLRGVDCDSFRLCSYVVEDEYGLLSKNEKAGSR
jgi:glutamine---fructose-6-phosphate transaminase (isomerizing)